MRLPARPDEAVRLNLDLPDGGKRTAFVDPHDAQLIGVTPFGGVMETVKQLHSLSIVGPWANYLVEIVAGWAVILVATGLFLWWPRKRDVGVAAIRATDIRRRPFWRDLHAVTGLYAGAIIAFLAVTGMPWSAFWGAQYANVVRESGIGRPKAPPAASAWAHAALKDHPAGVGWTMEGAVLPAAHVHDETARLSTVVAAADAQGLARPYAVSIPSDPALAFTAALVGLDVANLRHLTLETTGGSQLIADALLELGQSLPAAATLALLMVAVMLISNVVNNAAAAVLAAPVAISLARGMDASVDPFLMAVAIGASCAFLTPIGHQSNTLVMAPGGYRFGDYWRLGLPLSILVVLCAVPAILWIWPL